MLQQAIGGPEGEIRVAMQCLFQGWAYRGPDRYRNMILSTATEEIGHIKLMATAVSMNVEGAKSEQVDEIVTNPMVAARMGALEPPPVPQRWPSGDALRRQRRAVQRRLHRRRRQPHRQHARQRRRRGDRPDGGLPAAGVTDDPGMKDMLRFLIARDTMHQALQKAPPKVHAGIEATAPDGATNGGGVAARFMRLAADVADRLTPNPGGDAGRDYEAMTKEELLEEARKADIEGRSSLASERLAAALRPAAAPPVLRP
jgi:Mn-containing catalase